MKSKRKLITALTFSMFFLISQLLPTVLGDNYVALGLPSYYTYNKEPIADHFLEHSDTGKLVFYNKKDTNTINFRVFSSLGATLMNVDYDFTGYQTYYIEGCSLSRLDNDEVIIIVVWTGYTSTPVANTFVSVFRINVSTYTYNHYKSSALFTTSSGNRVSKARISNIVEGATGKFYAYIIGYMSGATDNFMIVVEYLSSTNVVGIETSNMTFYDGVGTSFQTPKIIKITDTFLYIIVWAGISTPTRSLSFDTVSNTQTLLSTFPTSYRMNYNEYFNVIDSGFIENGTDVYCYLSYTSGFKEVTTAMFDIVYLRQKFNGTISPATLLSQSDTAVNVGIDVYATYPMWSIGYLIEGNLSEIEVYYPAWWESAYHLMKIIVTLDDFYNIDETLAVYSNTEDTSGIIQFDEYYDVLWRTTHFQINLYSDYDIIIIYYALEAMVDDFTMTKGYTPIDVPLVQSKTYTFTYTFENNGSPFQGGIVLIYIDDALITSKVTNVYGVATIDLAFSSIGSHTIWVRMFKSILSSNADYEDETSYLVISAPTPSEDENIILMSDSLLNAALNILPVTLIVLMPAFYGGQNGGTIGFIAGLVIGVAVAVMSGILPFYYVYLLALVIAMGLIMVIRSGGGNKE